eukprot:TRINITY_DN6713_c0_g1_i1.p1 TRINITY_DN6713_c0_g1~~TRINITY_DN6713_c0_g1_i1.p1  ORF type:complete len:893 (+),score=139.48 TRINITY_DN6713_c0_g1_i1:40-2718(+)
MSKKPDDELNQASSRVQQFFQLPPGESVRDFWSCSMKGASGSGKLYVTRHYLCWLGKSGFKRVSKVWGVPELRDIRADGKVIVLAYMTNTVIDTITFSFPDADNAQQALKTIRRIFFGINGNDIIHIAVEELDETKVKQVLEYDVTKLHEVNRNDQTPLILACFKNNRHMVSLLLSYYRKSKDKVDINQSIKGYHLLHAICRFPNLDGAILTDILDFPGILVTAEIDYDKTTPLHYFCEHSQSLDCVKLGELFLKSGANPNAKSKQNETPLHKAIFNPKVRVMMAQMLIKAGASADMRGGHRGDTPLHYAVRLRRRDLVECLLAGGGDLTVKNDEGQDALTLAIKENNKISDADSMEIVRVIKQVARLNQMLDACGILDKSKSFVSEGLHDLEVLCQLSPQQLEGLGLGLNMGSRVKLTNEIETLRAELAKQKQDEKRKNAVATALAQKGDISSHISSKNLREELNMTTGGQWEIPADSIEFTAKLGSGTSGQVFKGLFNRQEVAIKVLNESPNFETELEEFKKEFEILRKVNSPYMIKFYGAVIEKNLCMVMELCERGSLHDVLLKNTELKLNWDYGLNFSRDIAEGISVLHNHEPPIIHRDLKSLNLLVTKDWRVKVCDFGLSRLVQGDLKTFNRLCGTFAYCAPEVFKGGMATEKSDVYSMGIVFWEILNTIIKEKYEQPFAEFSLVNEYVVLVQASDGLRPTIPKNSPASYVDVYNTCVRGEPEERPTATQVASIIEHFQEEYKKDPSIFLGSHAEPRTNTRVTGKGSDGSLERRDRSSRASISSPPTSEKSFEYTWKRSVSSGVMSPYMEGDFDSLNDNSASSRRRSQVARSDAVTSGTTSSEGKKKESKRGSSRCLIETSTSPKEREDRKKVNREKSRDRDKKGTK